jgi:signal transduction histidine kinase
MEDRDRIFEPFYRRGSELRRETPGIGIGLSIVKHIVEAHGGIVSLESEIGKGSRFIIRLPVNGTSTIPTDGTRAISAASPAQP